LICVNAQPPGPPEEEVHIPSIQKYIKKSLIEMDDEYDLGDHDGDRDRDWEIGPNE
jgi:hypothetical protein